MGSFIGHAVPGTFFFLFGLWWVTQTLRRHFLCRHTRQPFRSTLTFSVPYCEIPRLSTIPVESLVKIVLCVLGTVVEIIGGINHESHRFDSIGNTQHITMYVFFALSGVLDVVTAKGVPPLGTDYLGFMLALLVEGALFKFHLFGRSHLDVLLHTLLLYVIAFSVLTTALEAAYRNTAVLPMLRGLLTMVQGTWFWGLGFILYNPFPGAQPWDPEDHHSLMLAVVTFSWHVAFNVLITMAVGGAIACCYRNKARYSQLSTMAMTSVGGEEGQALTGIGLKEYKDLEEAVGEDKRRLISDEDLSDVEFEAPVVK